MTPDCMLCRDSGIQYLPDYPPVYRFCACAAGIAKRDTDPYACQEANAGYERLTGSAA